jgi:precorrin-8X/cobalt-precorrin-8 methylmutase
MSDWNLLPMDIEEASMAIIDQEAGDHSWPPEQWPVVRRMIHTSADFDYLKNVRMHPRAIDSGMAALRDGCRLLSDTRMAQAGISQRRLEPLGARVECLMDHPEVASRAKEQGTTRAVAAVDLALQDGAPDIFVIGNAPTALLRLVEHIQAGRANPALVVGVPVGFVNAAESKDALAKLDVPFITALGRKGGSNVAASVINALAIMCAEASQ